MRQEWRTYWKICLQRTSSLLHSIGIALLFYVAEFPTLPAGRRWISLVVSLQYGAAVFSTMYFFMAVMWACVTYQGIRRGQFRVPSNAVMGMITFPAVAVGLWLARMWEAWLTGFAPDPATFWNTLLAGGFIYLMFMFYYSYKYSKEENLKLKVANSEAKYNVLENQMKPHFLFNSLNSLAETISEDPHRASNMAQKLSDLYREILHNSKMKTASLASELSIVGKYLALEQIRFGQRLKIAISEPPESHQIYVPSLILQTLVENSIKHGIARSETGGEVCVAVESVPKGFSITVSNSAGEAPEVNPSRGTGLKNTQSRLELLYGNDHDFKLWHDGHQTRARFTVTGAHVP